MRKDQVLNRIKRVHPLALGAEHLLKQPQIFHRDPKLMGDGLQKFQFFYAMAPARRASQRESSNYRLLALHRQNDDVVNALLGKKSVIGTLSLGCSSSRSHS